MQTNALDVWFWVWVCCLCDCATHPEPLTDGRKELSGECKKYWPPDTLLALPGAGRAQGNAQRCVLIRTFMVHNHLDAGNRGLPPTSPNIQREKELFSYVNDAQRLPITVGWCLTLLACVIFAFLESQGIASRSSSDHVTCRMFK